MGKEEYCGVRKAEDVGCCVENLEDQGVDNIAIGLILVDKGRGGGR